jgi:hypothetical protein
MIVLNGKKFAECEEEFISSLFECGGTCVGYAKRHVRRISLFDINKKKIGFIANRVLGSALKTDSGKYWYSYMTPKIISDTFDYPNYTEEIRNLEKSFDDISPIYK